MSQAASIHAVTTPRLQHRHTRWAALTVLVALLACLGLASGCSDSNSPADNSASTEKGTLKGPYMITHYWIADEDAFTCLPGDTVRIATANSAEGAAFSKSVCREFAESACLEGTGRVRDPGSNEWVYINLFLGSEETGSTDDNPCHGNVGYSVFMNITAMNAPWGLGSNTNPLVPWRSAAINDIPFGTCIYVEELDGNTLPDGTIHDGCMRVDDESWSFGTQQMDFMAGLETDYETMAAAGWPNDPDQVTIYSDSPRCQARCASF